MGAHPNCFTLWHRKFSKIYRKSAYYLHLILFKSSALKWRSTIGYYYK